MKRKYAAAAGAVVLAVCLAAAFWVMHSRTPAVPVTEKGPVIACADVEHIMMSHPSYSQYHRLELEYNAMVASYSLFDAFIQAFFCHLQELKCFRVHMANR